RSAPRGALAHGVRPPPRRRAPRRHGRVQVARAGRARDGRRRARGAHGRGRAPRARRRRPRGGARPHRPVRRRFPPRRGRRRSLRETDRGARPAGAPHPGVAGPPARGARPDRRGGRAPPRLRVHRGEGLLRAQEDARRRRRRAADEGARPRRRGDAAAGAAVESEHEGRRSTRARAPGEVRPRAPRPRGRQAPRRVPRRRRRARGGQAARARGAARVGRRAGRRRRGTARARRPVGRLGGGFARHGAGAAPRAARRAGGARPPAAHAQEGLTSVSIGESNAPNTPRASVDGKSLANPRDIDHRWSMRLLRTVVPLAALFAASTAHAEPKPFSPSDAPGPSRGIDLAGMDGWVAPGDDFFDYANGRWVKKTPIPADKPAWGVLGELAEETIRRTRSLLEEASAAKAPPGSELRQVGDLYAGFMDESAIEKKGIAPLKPALARIAAVRDKTQLARLLGEALRADVDPLNNSTFYTPRLLGLWVAPDFNAPGQYAPYLLQGGLGMPDREFYLDGSPRMADIRTKYRAHVATVLKLAGVAAAAAKAARIVALETKIAKVHASREESVDVLKANNPWKRSEFAAKAPGLDWDTYFAAASLDKVPMIVVWHPGATKGLSALVAAEALADWKDWLTYHAVETRSAFLPRALADEHFAFFGKVLAGTPKQSDRWKRGVAFANALLGDAVGHIYVQKYFPAESKAQLQAMVKNIIAAFRARIDKIEWMTAATKAKAKEKLGTLYVGVGYPDKWVDYATLEIARDDVVGNVDRAGAFEYR